MSVVKAYAAKQAGGALEAFEYEPGELGPEEVEIKVQACGVCHSDLSMLNNDWGMTSFPFVPGHEAVGEIVALGEQITHLGIGQTVGLGWFSRSCMHCESCRQGEQHLCSDKEQTIVDRHGGFADRVHCHYSWAIPLPVGLDVAAAGPLFCGGITVFNPIASYGVRPTDRVGVVGIGGLGHLALQFLSKWGCEVTAFSSTEEKAEAAIGFGAHHVVNSRNAAALAAVAGTIDFLLVTVNVPLDWTLYLDTLRPKGRMHFVGAVTEPLSIPAFGLVLGQRSISGSPLGSPATTAQMLDFCVRHEIAPQIETFSMGQVNDAMEHLKAGNARYRIVLQND